ncbi:hypothetical protein [Streptomyces sp. NRRL S-920]|uniref:hypothetical protein n=1 Tax=Streptomyces sp. NRRL S-920 TaxID=1463921 RepID=UPI00068C42D8|nr:hypothetical protein [Streptomyces sp. NRRL S-920]
MDDRALDRMVDLGFATLPVRGALSAGVMEIAAHAWDLRQALGSAHELAPELAEFSLAFAHEALPPERVSGDLVINAHIMDGDTVIVRVSRTPRTS